MVVIRARFRANKLTVWLDRAYVSGLVKSVRGGQHRKKRTAHKPPGDWPWPVGLRRNERSRQDAAGNKAERRFMVAIQSKPASRARPSVKMRVFHRFFGIFLCIGGRWHHRGNDPVEIAT